MKYAIYGAGSLGLVASAILGNKSEDFTLIDRNVNSVKAINEKGIKITGKLELDVKVNCVLDTEVKEKFDIIFLITKQINNIETIKKAANMLTCNGVICTWQNGLPEKEVADIIGEDRTYGVAVGWGATRLNYGVSELTSAEDNMEFSLGSFSDKQSDKFNEIKRILNIIGKVEVVDNFIGARYVKLIINSAFSGMSTICGDTFGNVAKNKKSRKVIQAIIKECIDVAKAKNIKVEPIQGKDVVKLLDYHNKLKKWFGFIIIPLAIKKHSLLKASMLQDIEKGHLCEIDSINQVIVNLGKECNVLTPFNSKVVEIIKKEENNELKPSYANVDLFAELFK